jgi:hypothetical protein
MARKSAAIFTLSALFLFTSSCIKVRSTLVVPSPNVVWTDIGGSILAVQKKSGERVEFAKEGPGQFAGDSVVGGVWTHLEFDKSRLRYTKTDGKGRVMGVTTNDGQSYILKSSTVQGGRITGICLDRVSVPVSEVDLIWVRKVNAGATALVNVVLVVGVVAVVGYLAVAAALNEAEGNIARSVQGESCPFIYSFDGEDFHLDGEPYGGSICEGLKRTEWSGLDHLQDVNGQYRLLLTNELEETEHTDELKLVVVDHPRETNVVPDASGNIHTISQPLSPFKAGDQSGRDILPLVLKKDQIFWLTRTENKDPDKNSDLKDELIFEFPKPRGAQQVKLVANAWTSQWGTLMGKKFLEFYGRQLPEWYSSVNSLGTAFYKVMNWHLTEELYLLHVRVETDAGWKTKGIIYGSGAYVSKDKACVLDISDVSGDTLKIKLTPAATFWLLDSLAVDYTPDLPLNPVEISPVSAVDRHGRDFRDELRLEDGRCLVMPNEGDAVEMAFLAPPRNPALSRSIILKASGYYDVQVDASGAPQIDLIRRLEDERGFPARYALSEFQRAQWRPGRNLRLVEPLEETRFPLSDRGMRYGH